MYSEKHVPLISTTTKLLAKNMYKEYEKIFMDWIKGKNVDEIPLIEVKSYTHYLPYYPVIKESSSTNLYNSVFDASAKFVKQPYLNQCLHSGPNLIELIPDILLHFRKRFRVIADISPNQYM